MTLQRSLLVAAGLLCMSGGSRMVQAGGALQSLAEQIGLQEPGGRATCGLPLTLYVAEQMRAGRMPAGIVPDGFLARPESQTDILRGRFRIHFDTSGTQAAAMLNGSYQPIPGTAREYAEWIAVLAESSYQVESVVLGYPGAPPDAGAGGGDEYDIYIRNLDTLRIYGRTVPELDLGQRRSTTYIEIDNDFTFVTADTLKGLPSAAVTLAHEYHHAIQLGNYGDWGFSNIWYYEMTSVWMEDVVFPDVNDFYSYLRSSSGHFRHPEVPFTSPQYIVYSRGIWCHYLARRFSSDLIRQSWQQIGSGVPLEALDAVLHLAPYNSTLRTAFAEWSLWNYFTGSRGIPGQYYPDAIWYPTMITAAIGFTPPSRSIADLLAPLSTRYTQVLFHADTLTVIPVNEDIDAALADDLQTQPYTYLLNVDRPDATYRETAAGIFVKLDTPVPSNWYSWELVNGGVSPTPLHEGVPFPNPFVPGGRAMLAIPVPVTSPTPGTLTIFDASMTRVYTADAISSLLLGNYVFTWTGTTESGATAQSGIYLFVLDLPERRLTGKFALIRK
jgi:hypothetical protein